MQLAGARVATARQHQGGSMTVDLTSLLGLRSTAVVREPHAWHFAFDGGAALVAECPWRILVEGRIALGSADDR
jgi:hypothetical protein